jgi:hypothetical protein
MYNSLNPDKYIFQTDHSWTAEAAFEAFVDIVNTLNSRFDAGVDTDGFYRDNANYYFELYPASFLGSLGRRAGVAFSGVDDFTLIRPKFETDFTYEFVSRGANVERNGPFEDSLIFSEFLNLSGDVHSDSIISSYLGGVRRWGRIVNHNAPEAPSLLLIHDSFGPFVAPFLATVFNEVHMIRGTESRTPVNIEEYLQHNSFDYIIVMPRSENLTSSAMFNFYVNPFEDREEPNNG